MNTFPVLLIICLILASCGKKNVNNDQLEVIDGNFYSRGTKKNNSSSEAKIQFKAQLRFNAETLSQFKEEHWGQVISHFLQQQVRHLFGSFKMNSYKGVPKLGPEQSYYSDSQELLLDQETGEIIVNYFYEGFALVDQEFGPSAILPLPINPQRIYQQGKGNRSKNPCTDSSYNSEGDHWYFWNVKNQGCSLIEGVHYQNVEVKFEYLENTKKTFPAYERLAQKSEGKDHRQIPVYLFFGNVHEEMSVPMDLNGIDYLSSNHKDVEAYLKKNGFAVQEKRRLGEASVLHKYSKLIPQSQVEIQINVFYGNTGFREKDSEFFHLIYKEAVENSSILFYGGHSGLGGNLSLDNLTSVVGPITPPRDQYQIYFFDSCSSYPYYTEMYFEPKKGAQKEDGTIDEKGTYNLDIVTNGLSSYFVRNNLTVKRLLTSVINAFEKNQQESWQELVDGIHMDTMNDGKSYLGGHMISVSGDEDNATSLPPLSFDKNSLKTVEFQQVAVAKELNLKNYTVQNDHLVFRSSLAKMASQDYLVYALGVDGIVYYNSKNTEFDQFAVSAVNSPEIGRFKYISFIESNSKATLYLIDMNNKVWYKQEGEVLKESSRQHPEGLAFTLLGQDTDGISFGIDEKGQHLRWIQDPTSGSWSWINDDKKRVDKNRSIIN